ncbi:MAG: hypothetical protein KatS3mg008_1567 [Acidimicrobiales bacterium]|nr:MAG: hypothetical protein KatS3mg008_1567 [Acidimicrobiales bacterium]
MRKSALWLLLALLATGCRLDALVEIDVGEDGSGSVRVEILADREAAEKIPDLAAGPLVEDMREAGWRVHGPDRSSDGSVRFTATKRFSDPRGARAVLQELTGPAGPFATLRVSKQRSFGRSEISVRGDVRFDSGLATLSDKEIAELFGDPLGGNLPKDPAELRRTMEDVTVALKVTLPGLERTWPLDPMGERPTSVRASSTVWHWQPLAAAGVAVAAGLFAVIAGVGGLRRRRTAAGSPSDEPDQPPRRLRQVVLHAAGVLFDDGRDPADVFAEFVKDRQGSAMPEEVKAVLARLRQGTLRTDECWRVLRLEGDPEELTDQFFASRRLTPGVRQLLERLRESGVQAVVVDDQPREWSARLRDIWKLDRLVSAIVETSEIEDTAAESLVEEVLRGPVTDARHALFISCSERLLEVARSFGFEVVLYRPDGGTEPRGSLPTLSSFADLGVGASAS